jgi:hypothetical protein
MLFYRSSPSFLFVAAGAKISPRARLTMAIVLAVVHVPLTLWNQGLSRVSLVELVLFQGGGDCTQFALETSGAVLGVVCIFWLEKAKAYVASVQPSQLSLLEPSPGSAGSKASLTAVKTAVR